MNYRDTLNLPQTDLAMKANLPQREPEWLKRWEETHLYETLRQHRQGHQKFVLHDGPPYANGDIHAGTALNKIVKDIINRFWILEDRDVPFVPGFDTHGLPIEMRALKQLGVSHHHIDPLELRAACAEVARYYIDKMSGQFQRLGVQGEWDHPYITMDASYEGAELNVFADMVEKDLIYRDLKAVYWCPHCETALAEGEVEYHEMTSDAIYVAFPIVSGQPEDWPAGVRAVIWTTTPWTMPANVAIAVHPDLQYAVVQTNQGPLVLADDLVDKALATMKLENNGVVAVCFGRDLTAMMAQHPYLDRQVPFILGDHVTAESGTGLVHTAPGHGIEDFEAGKAYHLPVIQPLNDQGRFVADTPLVAGMFYEDANPVVIDMLKETGNLL
ncbi:MAG: class I tRNA ligase family protein, partial [Firmicutes bacterium]|nr:class I tRNA ligase family protein [Bacillota bacterium]